MWRHCALILLWERIRNTCEVAAPPFLRLEELQVRPRRSLAEALEVHVDGFTAASRRELVDFLRLVDRGSTLRCGTCAVVGSAGSLVGKQWGPEIDGHDCVFRLNVAVTWTWEEDVGTKHTIHVFTFPVTEEAVKLQRQRELLARFAAAPGNVSVLNVHSMRAIEEITHMARQGAFPLHHVRMLHPLQMESICSELGLECSPYQRPSTGLLAVHLAKQMCASAPRVYGFDANSIPFHYYDPPDTACDAVHASRHRVGDDIHNWTLEREQLWRWHQDNQIELASIEFKPAVDLSRCQKTPAGLWLGGNDAPLELRGLYVAQPYTVNGRVAYGQHTDTDVHIICYSFCKFFEGEQDWWAVVPHDAVARQFKQTPGFLNDCDAVALSGDFLPHGAAEATWLLEAGQPGFYVPARRLQAMPVPEHLDLQDTRTIAEWAAEVTFRSI